MTSSSSTPDLASQVATLSLASQPSQQRLHDTYDYEGNAGGNGRNPYHYSTSPPIPAQSQYNPLSMNQSPLKNKPSRAGLPTVRMRAVSPHRWPYNSLSIVESSNGSITRGECLTIALCRRLTTPICPPPAGPLL